MWFSARAVRAKGKSSARAASAAAATRSTAWSSSYSRPAGRSPRSSRRPPPPRQRARSPPPRRGLAVAVLEVDRHGSSSPGSSATCATTSSRVASPSRRPSVYANPELVVASASNPSAARTRAEPASHGLGMTNGSPSWRAPKGGRLVRLRRHWPWSMTLPGERETALPGADLGSQLPKPHVSTATDATSTAITTPSVTIASVPSSATAITTATAAAAEPFPGDPPNDPEAHECEARGTSRSRARVPNARLGQRVERMLERLLRRDRVQDDPEHDRVVEVREDVARERAACRAARPA